MEDCAQCFGEFTGQNLRNDWPCRLLQLLPTNTHHRGEGGMVCTNDDDLAWEIRSVRDHGYDVKERLNLLELEGKLMYIHKRLGYNFRMTEIQSQIGLVELARFTTWNLPNRIRNGKMLISALKDHPLVYATPVDTEERQNSFWWAPFVLKTELLKCDIKTFIKAVGAKAFGLRRSGQKCTKGLYRAQWFRRCQISVL